MLGAVDKFISNISRMSKVCKISEFIDTKANNILFIFIIIMVVETESTKCQPVDIKSDLF
jgi:hypothetical protein